jgi:hypothetical protein
MKPKKLVVSVLVLQVFIGAPLAFARNRNPRVLPPHSHAFGKSYGEWSAAWWQWALSIPANQHPLNDSADCNTGQSGKVFFLGGTFTAVPGSGPNEIIGSAERDCTIPTGKAVFFPILNGECSTIEGNGTTDAELRACAEFLADHVQDMVVTIDGKPLQDLDRYRAQSPLFEFGPLPNPNLFGLAPGGTSPSVADGFYLLLAPLSAGEHTIHFSGKAVFTLAEDGFDLTFILDITYNLNVVPRGQFASN